MHNWLNPTDNHPSKIQCIVRMLAILAALPFLATTCIGELQNMAFLAPETGALLPRRVVDAPLSLARRTPFPFPPHAVPAMSPTQARLQRQRDARQQLEEKKVRTQQEYEKELQQNKELTEGVQRLEHEVRVKEAEIRRREKRRRQRALKNEGKRELREKESAVEAEAKSEAAEVAREAERLKQLSLEGTETARKANEGRRQSHDQETPRKLKLATIREEKE